jgi:lipopolysaccharide export system protein LptA
MNSLRARPTAWNMTVVPIPCACCVTRNCGACVAARWADEMNGNLIVYDHTTDVFTVDGGVRTPNGAPVAGTTGTPSGRVRAVLTPRGTGPAAAASSPTPVAPANLRPSTRIGEERK